MKILIDKSLLKQIEAEIDGFLNGKPIEELYITFTEIDEVLCNLLRDNEEKIN